MGLWVSRASAATVSFATPQEVIINKDDDSITAYQGGVWNITDITGTISLPTGASTAAKQDTGNTTLSAIQTLLKDEFISGQIEAPTDKIYTLDLYAIDQRTIQTLTIKTLSGTCTVAIKIDGTSVTGISAVSVTSTETTATAVGLNTVAIGQTLTLVVSSTSFATDLVFTLKYQRT